MTNRLKLLLSVVVLLMLTAGRSPAAGDWRYYSRYGLSVPLKTNAIALLVRQELRFRNGMGELYLVKPKFGLAFKLSRYFKITPYYVYRDAKTDAGWNNTDISYLDGTLNLMFRRLYNLKMVNRLRNEYDWDKKTMFWRNSLRLTRAIAVRRINISPFIEEEIFYKRETGQFIKNRASIGLAISMRKYLSFSAAYMLETDRTTDGWANSNVLVSSLNLRF
ncbi:DUF2490 domain-containing protein [Verrucomicrobiota bacterium]